MFDADDKANGLAAGLEEPPSEPVPDGGSDWPNARSPSAVGFAGNSLAEERCGIGVDFASTGPEPLPEAPRASSAIGSLAGFGFWLSVASCSSTTTSRRDSPRCVCRTTRNPMPITPANAANFHVEFCMGVPSQLADRIEFTAGRAESTVRPNYEILHAPMPDRNRSTDFRAEG